MGGVTDALCTKPRFVAVSRTDCSIDAQSRNVDPDEQPRTKTMTAGTPVERQGSMSRTLIPNEALDAASL